MSTPAGEPSLGSVNIADFRYGTDRRRPRVAGVPGTLWLGVNVHISRGGDIQAAKKFVPQYTLPSNTFGMNQVNGQLFVFGSADNAGSMPNGVQYQRLQAPGSPAMTSVLLANSFDGRHYVIADYNDGNIHHFYDGTRVSDFDALADAASSYTTLAEYLTQKLNGDSAVESLSFGPAILLTAKTPGTAFSLSTATLDVGGTNDQTAVATTVQANVVEVEEVRATGSVTITGGTRDPGVNKIDQVTVDGVSLMEVPVDWRTSNNATATALAAEINNRASTHGFTASAAGAVVTIRAEPGTGASPNGDVVARTISGNVTATVSNMASGVTYVAPVAQVSKIVFGGTFEPTDKFTITLNSVAYVATGRASGHGTFAFVHKGREYINAGSLLRYSQVDDPDDFTDADENSGAGFINLASDAEGNDRSIATAKYQSSVAVFSRKAIRIYDLFTDAELNELRQTLENTGTIAPRSVVGYANTDVLYLDEPGVRSLKVRDVNGNAFSDDFASQIDPLVLDWIRTLSPRVVSRAVAAVEPVDGRYMLAIGTRIFVLSSFPNAKINAWSYYEPGFTVTDFMRVDNRLYARDTGTIYLYGGVTGVEYPARGAQTLTIETPFASAQSPAMFKEWLGFDIACYGTWDIDLLVDPEDETKVINIGKVTGTTYGLEDIAALGRSPMFAVRLTCNSGGPASVSSMTAHYDRVENG